MPLLRWPTPLIKFHSFETFYSQLSPLLLGAAKIMCHCDCRLKFCHYSDYYHSGRVAEWLDEIKKSCTWLLISNNVFIIPPARFCKKKNCAERPLLLHDYLFPTFLPVSKKILHFTYFGEHVSWSYISFWNKKKSYTKNSRENVQQASLRSQTCLHSADSEKNEWMRSSQVKECLRKRFAKERKIATLLSDSLSLSQTKK